MNEFQSRYPLSRKKFWKKLIPKIIWMPILLAGIYFAVVIFVSLGSNGSSQPGLTSLIGMVFVVFYVVAILLYAWYFKEYIRTYYYNDAGGFITIRKRVFTPSEIHVQYQKVQDVYVDQDLLDRIMGLYDVHLASATFTSGIEAHIDGVEKEIADGLKTLLLDRVREASANAGGQPQASNLAPLVGPQPTPALSTPDMAIPAPPSLAIQGVISSETYPIQPVWMVRSIMGIIASSVFLGFVFAYWLLSQGNTSGEVAPGSLFGWASTIAIALFVIKLIPLVIWRMNYRYAFLPDYIMLKTGIISMSETHVPYRTIQDVNVSRSVWDRVFGLANVTVQNAVVGGKGVVIPGQTVASASAITEVLKGVLFSANRVPSTTGL